MTRYPFPKNEDITLRENGEEQCLMGVISNSFHFGESAPLWATTCCCRADWWLASATMPLLFNAKRQRNLRVPFLRLLPFSVLMEIPLARSLSVWLTVCLSVSQSVSRSLWRLMTGPHQLKLQIIKGYGVSCLCAILPKITIRRKSWLWGRKAVKNNDT